MDDLTSEQRAAEAMAHSIDFMTPIYRESIMLRVQAAIAAAEARGRAQGERGDLERAALVVERWSLPTIQAPRMWLIDKAGIAAIRALGAKESNTSPLAGEA